MHMQSYSLVKAAWRLMTKHLHSEKRCGITAALEHVKFARFWLRVHQIGTLNRHWRCHARLQHGGLKADYIHIVMVVMAASTLRIKRPDVPAWDVW